MRKILVVEDEPTVRKMLRRRLEHQGYEVVEAEDGSDALALIATEHPALVLMDLNIPLLDGWTMTRQLRADPVTAKLPVIAVSANIADADVERALSAGCNDFEPKPVDFQRLFSKIRQLTES